jgi:hypothetical protein
MLNHGKAGFSYARFPMIAHSAAKFLPVAALIAAMAAAGPVYAQGAPTPLLPQPGTREEPPAASPASPSDQSTETAIGGIHVDELGPVRLPSDAVGTIDGFGPDLWRGASRASVATYLPRMPSPASSSAVRSLALRLLLTSAVPPPAPPGAAVQGLLAMRLDRLAALGDADDFVALTRALPNADDETSVRGRIEAALLAGDDNGACMELQSVGSSFQGKFWTRAATFCDIVGGRTAQAQLALDMSGEQGGGANSPYALLLRAVLGERNRPIANLAGAGPVEVALLRRSKAEVAGEALDNASPLALRTVALGTGQLPVRLEAAERAEAIGAIPTDKLAAAYATVPFKNEELANALTMAATDPSPRGRALFYRAEEAQQVPAAKVEAIKAALASARDQGKFAQAARLYAGPIAAVEPAPELAWFAEDAARVLYAVGNFPRAEEWRALAARGPEGASVEAILWPFAAFAAAPVGNAAAVADAGTSAFVVSQAKPFDSAGFRNWLASLSEPDRAGKGAIALTLLDSLGVSAPPEIWAPFLDTAATAGRSSPLLGPLARAAEGGRVGETVLLGLTALGSGDPARWSPETVAAVDAALLRVKLGPDARALAIETAVGAGF